MMLMPVATMAELVWHAVAGMRVNEFFVIDSAGSIGSIAPSRSCSRHFFLADIRFRRGDACLLGAFSSMGGFYFFGEVGVDAQRQDLLRPVGCCCGVHRLRAMISLPVRACEKWYG